MYFYTNKINEMRTNEMDKNKLMEIMDEMKEIMGADELLESLALALSSDELQDNLEYIDRMHDLNVFDEESE